MASEKAAAIALNEFVSLADRSLHDSMRAALDAAAAVDGDAQGDEAIEAAANKFRDCGCTEFSWADACRLIRSLKRG
jgi:hypothetical protein